MSKGKEVASWQAALDVAAAKAQVAAVADQNAISTKGGNMFLGDRQFPNNEVQCIILGYAIERTYYDTAFDADVVTSPACFALGESPDQLVPHKNVDKPQHDNCSSCPLAEFGTAAAGKGPACKTRAKLVLISASDNPNPDEIAASKCVTVKTTPASTKNWYEYLGGLGAKGQACWSAISRVYTKPSKFMFSVNFSPEGKLTAPEQLSAAFARTEEAQQILEDGAWTYEEEEALPEAKFAKK